MEIDHSKGPSTRVLTTGAAQPILSSGAPCFVVLYGGALGRRFRVEEAVSTIGRSSSCEIVLDGESVSRIHAEVRVVDDVVWITDRGSSNGTLVNGEAVVQAALRDADLVRVGNTLLKFLSGSNVESKYHEDIFRLSTRDGLTDAYNKEYFLQRLQMEVERALRYERQLSLVLLDIDHFKSINDLHGHLVGDEILRALSQRLRPMVRGTDVFSRYGGEEFAVLLPELSPDAARGMAEKMRAALASAPFVHRGGSISVTGSFGVAALGADFDPQRLIAAADAALYSAKANGRNQVEVAGD